MAFARNRQTGRHRTMTPTSWHGIAHIEKAAWKLNPTECGGMARGRATTAMVRDADTVHLVMQLAEDSLDSADR